MPYPQRPFQICLRFVRQIFESSPWRARNGNAGGKPVGPGSDPRIARAASAREFGGEPRGVVVPFPGVRGWRGADGDEPAGPLPGGSAGARSCPGGLRGGRSAQVCGVVLRFFCAIQFAALLLSTANTAVSAAETRVAPGLTGLPTSSLEDYDPALNGEGDARAEFVLNDGDSAARSQLFSVALSVNPEQLSEDDAATTVTVTAELDQGARKEATAVTVSVGSANDWAAPGVDYAAVSDFVVTIPAGSRRGSESFTLTPIDDEIAEDAERITVHGVFEHLDLIVEPAELVLNDDDPASSSVALSVNPEQISEDDAATTVTVTAELDQGARKEATAVTVSVGSADDAAASGVDYAAVSEFVVTIPEGSRHGSESFTLTPIDDEIAEGAERITVHGVFEGLIVEAAELVLNDDGDSSPISVALSVNPEQISEDDAATTVTVTAELDQGARKEATAVTVSVGSADDAAASGVDYAAVSEFVVTIPEGSRHGSESFTLTPIDDEIAEDAETITVHGVFEGLIAEPAELVLNDDDAASSAVALSVNPEQISEDDAATTVTVTAKLDQGARKEATVVTVSVGGADDSAASGADYAAVSEFVVTIPEGSRHGSESFTLTPIDDEIAEDAERITVHGVFEGLIVEAAELVLNDDGDSSPISVALSVNPEQISEDDAATTVTVTAELLSARKEATVVTVSVGSAGDAAASGVDYAAVSEFVVTIPEGSRHGSESFTLTPIDDQIAEDAERITVHGVFEDLIVEPAELVLNDDDPASSAVALSVNPEQISEDDAATTVTVTAELDQGARKEATAVTVSVGSADDAAASGVDYAAVSEFVVTIPAGSRRGSESFTLTPIDDEFAEDAERITVHGVFEGLIVEPAELVLNDDDPASSSVALSVNPEQISEDDAATTVTVTAELDQGARKEATAVTVSVGSAGDAAASGVDYAAVSEFVVTIPAGSRHGSESFTLTPIDDEIVEDAERITVHGVFEGFIVEPAELVLNDGDPTSSSVALSVNPEQISEDDAATTVTVTAELDQGARKEATAVTVSVGSADDAAAPGVDYAAVSDFVVTIPAGSRRGSESFTLTPIDDEIAEDAERITVHGVFGGLLVEPVELVLNDDDPASSSVALSVNPEQISEDDAATTVTVTAELDQGARKEATAVAVSVGSANDWAAPGVDYAAVSDFVVTIPAGSRRGSESFTLTPIDDEIAEDAERITVHGVFGGLLVEPAELVLNDDGDSPPSSVVLLLDPVAISEEGGAHEVALTAQLFGGMLGKDTSVSIRFGATGDAAVSGVDYRAIVDSLVVIPAGEESATTVVRVMPNNDDIAEGPERITVHGVSRGLPVEPAILVLNDGDSASSSVALSVNPEQISEDDAATTVTVTAELDQGARKEATAVTVSVGSANDSAASGADYAAVSEFVVTIPAGSRRGSESFTLTPIDDQIAEDAERITVHGVFGGLLVEPAELVLNDDGDSPPSSVVLLLDPVAISEEGGAHEVALTAQLFGGMLGKDTSVSIRFGATGDAAVSGVDYRAVGDSLLVIPAGEESATTVVRVMPNNDDIAEGPEQITVDGRSRGLTVEPATLVLNDDDLASSAVALSVNPEQISEDDAVTTVTVTAELDQGARNEATVVTVSVGSANDSAASSVDYAAVSDFVVTIPAGSRRGSGSFTLTPIDDRISEGAEQITVHGRSEGLTVEPAELVLNDGDSPSSSVALSVNPEQISEDDAATTVTVTAKLDQGARNEATVVTVSVGSANDSAASSVDYAAVSDFVVTIPAGSRRGSESFTLTPIDDRIFEGAEQITVHGRSEGLTVTVEPAELVLNDGDSPSSSVALSVNPEQISEDDAATTVTVTAELDQGARNEATAVTVSVGGGDDSAASGGDYAAVSDFVVTIPAGSRRGSESFTLTPIDDRISEGAEQITVHGRSEGLTVEPAELVLNDGDSPSSSVALSVNPEQISEDDAATTVTVTAKLDQGARNEATVVTVSVGSANDSAASGGDYAAVSDFVVTIPAGSRRGSESFTLTPIDDRISEGAEQITVHGRSEGLTVEPAELVLNDGDSPSSSVALSVNPEQISEDDAATTVTVTAELDQGARNEATVVMVSVGGADDSAASSVDYAAVSDFVVTIPAGSRRGSESFTLTPIDDRIFEGAEQITVHGRSEGLTVEPAELVLNDGDSPSSSVALSVNPGQISEDDAATTVTVTAKLDQGARNEATAVTVSVGGGDDSAASGGDYAAVSDFVVTIPAGSRRGSESFTLIPIDDRISEGAEQITVHGRSEGLTVEPAELVLNDGDSPSSSVALSVNPEQISEDDAATTVTVTAKLDQGARNEATVVTVSVGGGDDSAASGGDYAAVSDFVVTIPAGSRRGSESFTLIPIDDRTFEGAEQITVHGRSRGLTVEPAELVLNDGDSPSSSVALSVNPEQISEDDAATTVTVTAKLDQGARNEATVVTVSVGGGDDSAASGGDYAAVSDFVVTIPAGSRRGSESFTLIPIDDRIFEGAEQITVHGRSRGLTVEPAELVLNDGDSPSSSVALSVNPGQISEDDAATIVTVTAKLDQGARNEATVVTVSVGSANDSAASGGDYAAVSDFVVTIPAGSRRGSGSFTLTPIDDQIAEDAERITVHGTASGFAVEPATLRLTDDDGDIEPPVVPTEIRILDSRAREGAGIMRFSVRLDKAPSASIAVDWGTQPLAFGPKSADEDVDYLGAFGTLVIPSGQTSGRITVHLRDDLLDEFDERFQVVLFGASAGEIADDIAVGTIMDDDEPELRIADEHASESAGWLEFAVSLSAPSVQVIEGRIATSDVTATAGQDYEPVEAVFQIRPGRQIHTVRVRVSNDSLDEDDETFVLAVTNVRNAVVADGEAEGTIEDDDALPTLHTADESAAEDNGELAFQVWLNVRSGRSVRVDYRTSELTAGDGEDFEGASGTIEFLPGELSKRIAVRLLDDELDEADETFELALSAPANAIVEVPRAVGTIEDDDVEPSLRMEDARASENAGTIGFSATLEAVAGRDLRYSYWTTDAEALAGEDYEGRRAEFVIPAGATTAILAVPLVDDAFDEAEETFLVSLNNPREAGIGTITCIGTIEDDDGNERAARMWITRFGRSVATQVMESVEDRMDDGSRGSRLSLGLDPMPTLFQVASRDTLGQSWSDVRERANGLFGLNGRELLERGAFLVQPGADSGQQPRGWAFWGRGATLRFAGEEDGISVNGDVFTTTVGMDYRRGRTLAGFALSNSLGTGGFEVAGSEHNGSPRDGVADSRISILSPYVSVPLGERVSVWGLGGYGIGTMSLAAEDGKSDLSMRLGAIGARGNLWPGMGGSRLQLALKADMFWTRVDAGATAVRPASTGLVSRGRVLAEGSWRLGSLWGGEITPILEAGLRYDAGDAETGLGLEVGSGFRYRHPTRGLSVELTGRTLAVHQDKAYREWGIGGTVRIDPGDDRRGLSLSLASSHGQALSGVNRLWNGRSPLVPGTQFAAGGSARLEGEVGYGFGGFAIGSLTPYAGVALQEDASRAFRLGSRLQLGSSLQLSVEGSRRLGSFTGPDHSFVIRGHLR